MELTTAQIESLIRDAQKGRNINNVTHDVNNLLGAIMAYAELIQMDTTDPEMNRMIEEILGAVEKGAEILSALTVISRNSKQNTSDICDIAKVLRSINLLFAYEFKLGLIQTQFSSDEGVDSAKIGEPILQRVLMHIIANALEAIRDLDEKTLSINASLEETYVCLTIKDSGGEIEQDVLPRMFEPGFSTKDEKHVGMGLSISKTLLESANGRIQYDPQSGFKILVPHAG